MAAGAGAVLEIALAAIAPCPMNLRKRIAGPKFDELVASIRQKGVIEPIIVRPVKGKKASHEVVAGERRFKAAGIAGLSTIPAIVRELTDDEAYDFMLIENLQREDLTDREEAESFKAWVDRSGEMGVQILAEKIGISQAYIRSRIRILALPTAVLKAWEKGDLAFGHLHQLLRVTDEKELKEMIDWALERIHNDWEGPLTIKELAREIDDKSPALSGALFGTKDVCAKCPSNSMVQKDLFGIESAGARCLSPGCFKKHQAEWLTANWKASAAAKKHGTNGFRFHEDVGYDDVHQFYEYGQPAAKKCRECPDFVTVFDLSGKIHTGQACAGGKVCYGAITSPRSSKERETGDRDPEAPRSPWHGEYFRDMFLSKRIPEVLAGIDPDDPKIKVLLLVCAVHGNSSTIGHRDLPANLLGKPATELRKAFKTVVEKVILSGQHIGNHGSNWGSFGTDGRRRVAEYLGIDLAKEFSVDKDYLEKKTKAEILAFGKNFKILKVKNASNLKKSELVKLVLAHGAALVGKVPAEILKDKK
jgi:ParB family chromosome partitioning protein